MPNKCVAIGCESGKVRNANADVQTTFHKFPMDDAIYCQFGYNVLID